MGARSNMWIRKTGRTRVFAAVAVVWSVAMLMVPVVATLPGNSHWHNTVGNDLGIALFGVVLAASGFWMTYRLATAGLWMGPESIVVRGPIRTWTVALADADTFVPGVRGGGNGTPCPVLKRRNGTEVGIWALGREGVVSRFRSYKDAMQPLCDELNVALRDLKAGVANSESAVSDALRL